MKMRRVLPLPVSSRSSFSFRARRGTILLRFVVPCSMPSRREGLLAHPAGAPPLFRFSFFFSGIIPSFVPRSRRLGGLRNRLPSPLLRERAPSPFIARDWPLSFGEKLLFPIPVDTSLRRAHSFLALPLFLQVSPRKGGTPDGRTLNEGTSSGSLFSHPSPL